MAKKKLLTADEAVYRAWKETYENNHKKKPKKTKSKHRKGK